LAAAPKGACVRGDGPGENKLSRPNSNISKYAFSPSTAILVTGPNRKIVYPHVR
jgi:hypothetical protein